MSHAFDSQCLLKQKDGFDSQYLIFGFDFVRVRQFHKGKMFNRVLLMSILVLWQKESNAKNINHQIKDLGILLDDLNEIVNSAAERIENKKRDASALLTSTTTMPITLPRSTRSPTWSTRSPTWSTRSPTWSTRSPTWSTRSPTRFTRSPTWSTRSPTWSTRSPTWSTRSPTWSTRSPTWSTRSPTWSTRSPTWFTRSPTWSTRSPTWSTRSPTWFTRSPTWFTRSPTWSTRSPTWFTGSPITSFPRNRPMFCVVFGEKFAKQYFRQLRRMQNIHLRIH